jgi:polysaccharide pyruvyl transferase WcaK-like protein
LEFVKAHLHEFELLIVNGEGTLHHDCPKALSLCRAAQYADAQGKKAVLINTVWQDNDKLQQFLPSFQLIAARESRSQAAIACAGHSARVVADLVFASGSSAGFSPQAAKNPATTDATVVIDSVDRQTTLRWAWRALIRRHGMLVMHPTNYERLVRRPLLVRGLARRSGVPLQLIGHNFAEQLGSFARVISGRFHGCCLAMLVGIPVLGLASNTHKIEGLFDDAGLGRMAIVNRGSRRELEDRFRRVENQQDKVQRFVSTARGQIGELFDDIARIANGERAA